MAGWIGPLARSCLRRPWLTAAALITAVLGLGLSLVAPLALGRGVEFAVEGRTDGLPGVVLLIALAAVVVFVSSIAQRTLAGRLALDVQNDVRKQLFNTLQRLGGREQDQLRSGEAMARSTVDLQMLQGFLLQVPSAAGSLVLLVGAFVAIVLISPLLAVVHVAMVAAIGAISVRSSGPLSAGTMAVQHRQAVLAQRVTEAVSGIFVLKGFGRTGAEVDAYVEQSGRLYGERMRVARLQATPMAHLQTLPLLAQVAILGLGGWLVIRGELSVAGFVTFSTLTTTLLAPAATLSQVVVAAALARPAIGRVYALVGLRARVVDPDQPHAVPSGPVGVLLADVEFGYDPERPVLRGVDLEVRPGETVAIVGPSGAGKSTLALLIQRFYDPQSGTVSLSGSRSGSAGATAVDLREVSLAALRSTARVVFQQPRLITGTIAANIGFGSGLTDSDRFRAAAEAAGAAEFVAALPEGYQTECGEGGSALSGGQRQRISLARALLADPRVLVLDDATSALDADTAARVHASVLAARAAADRTTVAITHRRSLAALADRVVVLDQGTVVDTGPLADVERRCPLLARVFAAGPQAADGEPGRDAASAADRPDVDLWAPTPPDPHPATVDVDGLAMDADDARAVAALPPAQVRPQARLAAPEMDHRPVPGGLFAVLGLVRGAVLVAIALMLGDAVVTTVLPLVIQAGFDDGIGPGHFDVVAWFCAGSVVMIALNWVLLFWQPLAVTRTGESAMYAMRVRSLRHLLALGMEHFTRSRAGLLLTRMTADIAALGDFVEAGLTVAVVNLATIVVMALAMLLVDPLLALTAFAVLPVMLVATLVFRRLSAVAYEESRAQLGEVSATLQEGVVGVRENQEAGRSDAVEDDFGRKSDAWRRIRMRAQVLIGVYFPFLAVLNTVAIVAVLWVGAHRVVGGSLAPGVLIAFLLYLNLFFAPFQQLATIFDGYQRARVGVLELRRLLELPAPPGPGPHPVRLPVTVAGELRCEGLGLVYSGGDLPALDHVDAVLPAGARVALVGTSGSGKTTLLHCLARLFEPSAGRVLLDGVDLAAADPQEVADHVAVVPQEPVLFSGTVADNLRLGRPGATDAEVEQAAREVGALELIAALPGGFTHRLVPGPGGLSAGQGQLLCLARAHLAARELLLLDEPTARLDPGTERLVAQGLARASRGRTTVWVTHRLDVAADVDLVLVMDHGRVVEHGRPEVLAAAGGRYAQLLALEAGRPATVPGEGLVERPGPTDAATDAATVPAVAQEQP